MSRSFPAFPALICARPCCALTLRLQLQVRGEAGVGKGLAVFATAALNAGTLVMACKVRWIPLKRMPSLFSTGRPLLDVCNGLPQALAFALSPDESLAPLAMAVLRELQRRPEMAGDLRRLSGGREDASGDGTITPEHLTSILSRNAFSSGIGEAALRVRPTTHHPSGRGAPPRLSIGTQPVPCLAEALPPHRICRSWWHERRSFRTGC